MKKLMHSSLAMVLAVLFVLLMLPTALGAAPAHTYTLDVGAVEDEAQGSGLTAISKKAGTDDYFTIAFSSKSRIESNSKDFEDGFAATKRLNFGGNTKIGDTVRNAVQTKTSGPATVKIWWVSGGDRREIAAHSEVGEVLSQTSIGSVKNSL